MIVQLTWHGEPIGKLDVQFVWPPPLDRGALLPLLSASSGSAAISVVFQFSGALDALELDLARPIVSRGPLGGPTEVGAFQGNVEARFDEVDVHGFVAAPLASRGAKGPRVLIQGAANEARFSLSGSGLAGHLEITSHNGLLTFGAVVEGPSSQVRAYPHGGGVIELRSEQGSALLASLNWRWPRSFDDDNPWAVALQALLEFITKHQSASLLLGFELASAPEAAQARAPTLEACPLDRAIPEHPRAAPPPRSLGASRGVLLGGAAVALVVFIAAVLLWKPSGMRPGSTVLLPTDTVSTGALQPMPTHSAGAGNAGMRP